MVIGGDGNGVNRYDGSGVNHIVLVSKDGDDYQITRMLNLVKK